MNAYTTTRTFAAYMKAVDAYIQSATGLTVNDIDDWRYYDDYHANISPQRCAKRAIKNASA